MTGCVRTRCLRHQQSIVAGVPVSGEVSAHARRSGGSLGAARARPRQALLLRPAQAQDRPWLLRSASRVQPAERRVSVGAHGLP